MDYGITNSAITPAKLLKKHKSEYFIDGYKKWDKDTPELGQR